MAQDKNTSTVLDASETDDFIVDEATDEVLRIHLDSFEGPFEVLLYLIKAQEIDIFDIPIMKITEQYLRFLDLMERANLDVASDYLVMAATLIQIKAKMLLPVEMDSEDDEEADEGDPRMELVEKLIAYRRYKDMAGRLERLEEERANWYARNVKPDLGDAEDEEEEFVELSLYDLVKAFKGVLRFLHEDVPHTVASESSSVDQKIDRITELLDMNESVAWVDLFSECRDRVEMVCCFLAILELCRMRHISAHQHRTFGDIRLFRRVSEESNAA